MLAPEPYLASVVHAGGLVAALGSPEQKADLLGRLSAGEIVLAAADTSPGGRWASRADGVRASVSGDAWTLDGVADPVVGGESADDLVVTAALPDDGGTGVFVVGADDVERTGYAAADLTRAASVRFDGSAATPLGEPGRDLRPSIATISDLTRIMGANQALGVMQSQVRATTDYLKSRKQFGVTLNTFQALTFRAADMYVSLELAHSMVDWATMTIAGGDRDVVADAADRVGPAGRPRRAPHRPGGDPAPRRHRHDRGVRRRRRDRPPRGARPVARQRAAPPVAALRSGHRPRARCEAL